MGQPLEVSWRTDVPHDKNWIGIYPPSAGTPDGNPASTQWKYAPGTSGTMSFQGLAAGTWLVYFLAQDKYGQLTEPVEITITADPPGTPGEGTDTAGDGSDTASNEFSARGADAGSEPEPIIVEPESEVRTDDCRNGEDGSSTCVAAPSLPPVADQPEAHAVQPEAEPSIDGTIGTQPDQQPEAVVRSQPQPAGKPETDKPEADQPAADQPDADQPQPRPAQPEQPQPRRKPAATPKPEPQPEPAVQDSSEPT
ncbi:MAG: hypothetical protein VB093_01280 [Propionicimonas sp.]|nr:hypothetical protein [Propionicimonas sp.]